MQPAFPQRIAILGVGLIGGSLARALKTAYPEMHIAAFDLSHETLLQAMQQGFIHSHHAHAGQAASDADIIIFAAPPAAIESLATDIAPFIKPGAIVTDTVSVKRFAIDMITKHLPAHCSFVPGHPIAGSERGGLAGSNANLFRGKQIILTPKEEALRSEPVAHIRALWEAAGAKAAFMPADIHDRIYAYVSHLPQLLAYAASAPLHELPPGGDPSYVKFTRLMKSDPNLWAEICLTNTDYILQALEDFSGFAAQMQGELLESEEESVPDPKLAAILFPRVVASCLIATTSLLQELMGVHPARYAGAGFADMIAPAVSNAEDTLSAISTQHSIIAQSLKKLLNNIDAIRGELGTGNKKRVAALFSQLSGQN